MEQELDKLNWESRFDTFISYWKNIGDYTLHVSRHIKETKWTVTLIDCDNDNEIVINYNANFKWLMDLANLLYIAEN
jgi:hypothetical protein